MSSQPRAIPEQCQYLVSHRRYEQQIRGHWGTSAGKVRPGIWWGGWRWGQQGRGFCTAPRGSGGTALQLSISLCCVEMEEPCQPLEEAWPRSQYKSLLKPRAPGLQTQWNPFLPRWTPRIQLHSTELFGCSVAAGGAHVPWTAEICDSLGPNQSCIPWSLGWGQQFEQSQECFTGSWRESWKDVEEGMQSWVLIWD